jgi:hypothetical protein
MALGLMLVRGSIQRPNRQNIIKASTQVTLAANLLAQLPLEARFVDFAMSQSSVNGNFAFAGPAQEGD